MKTCKRAGLLVGIFAAAAVLPGQAWAQTRLIATVADPASISLTTADGRAVRDLPAGSYAIEVRDRSSEHNFHLSGPGVDERTGVDDVGTVTWQVTLRDRARYTFVCDPHSAFMRGSFTTGGGPPTTPPPPPARAQTLHAVVGPGNSISLRGHHGGRLARVAAGRYRIVVRDRSARHNFHLIGPGVNKRTTPRFRGTVTWSVTLRKGRAYRYVSDRAPKSLRGTLRAA